MTLPPKELLNSLRCIIPALSNESYKGQAGKIGVVGGSFEYTGAPFFAAMSAMKMGAELSHVFCTVEAGTAIKSYSPDLIVHPVLLSSGNATEKTQKPEDVAKRVGDWMSRLHGLIIGPGLGRDPFVWDTIAEVISLARKNNLFLVLDGDCLGLISTKPQLIKDYPKAILTPNLNEYKRLLDSVGNPKSTKELSERFGNVTIVQKGRSDVITDGKQYTEVSYGGSPRRCGGQGDILTGTIATFLAWTEANNKTTSETSNSLTGAPLAALGGSIITRYAATKAFEESKRAVTTTDILNQVGAVFEELFPANSFLERSSL